MVFISLSPTHLFSIYVDGLSTNFQQRLLEKLREKLRITIDNIEVRSVLSQDIIHYTLLVNQHNKS